MKKYTNSKELNDDLKNGKIKNSESVILEYKMKPDKLKLRESWKMKSKEQAFATALMIIVVPATIYLLGVWLGWW